MKLLTLFLLLTFSLISARSRTFTLEELRLAIKAKGYNWQAGETSNSRLPEALRGMNVMKLDRNKQPINSKPDYFAKENLKRPSKLDWRDYNGHNWITPIRNQGGCGSCWAFGSVGAWEPVTRIAHNNATEEIDYSEQYLVSDCFPAGNCSGCWPSSLYPFLKSNGCIDEDCWPYEGRNSACNPKCTDWESRLVKMTDYRVLGHDNEAVKQAVTEGPVSTTMDVYEDFYYNYTEGVYRHTSGGSVGLHVVAIIGYNDDEEGGYWYCKNSWGTGWGEQGFFRIGYDEAEIPWANETHLPIMQDEAAKSITVVYPNGGENLDGGSSVFIEWITTGNISLVDLFFSTNSGNSWETLATNQNNNGSFNWTVPNIDAISCLIKIADSQDTSVDQSDGVFEIHRTTGFNFAKGTKFAPSKYGLSISPIPFFKRAMLKFDLPNSDMVSIEIFDVNGKKVSTVCKKYLQSGRYNISVDTSKLRSGVYFFNMKTENYNTTLKAIHLD
ncbi:MAG: T9SS type A sorting domain-containing protein [Candidatus Coatesbacteria bacterium]|nr:T9SS type A sorting domain-containing protein [Candidatus Coatesbacteria bacterium]